MKIINKKKIFKKENEVDLKASEKDHKEENKEITIEEQKKLKINY